MEKQVSPVSCRELLAEYQAEKSLENAKKIVFLGVNGYDVYNFSSPFTSGGDVYIAARVEKREDELSHVRLFKRVDDTTYSAALPEKTFLRMQDPFVTRVGDEIILGGVQITSNPLDDREIINWRTLFFRGKTVEELTLFATGPNKMKDIRLVEMPGKIGIFTRPQGAVGGLGQIGFIAVNSLEEVNEQNINRAVILDNMFMPDEWGGANEVHPIQGGLLGVFGHIACRCQQGSLHYHAMCFAFDPQTFCHTTPKILAARKDLPDGPVKRRDLTDVLFTAGINRLENGKIRLYAGMSDCEGACCDIPSPFEF